MSNAPTCRQCRHSTWELTPRGGIRRGTRGTCAQQTRLAAVLDVSPCLRPAARPIWPTTRAGKCPAFTPKAPPC